MTSTGAKGTRNEHACPRHGWESCALNNCGRVRHYCLDARGKERVKLDSPPTREQPGITSPDPATQLFVAIEDARERGWVEANSVGAVLRTATYSLTEAGLIALHGAESRMSQSNRTGIHGAAEQQQSE